jgi:hypothetical protein
MDSAIFSAMKELKASNDADRDHKDNTTLPMCEYQQQQEEQEEKPTERPGEAGYILELLASYFKAAIVRMGDKRAAEIACRIWQNQERALAYFKTFPLAQWPRLDIIYDGLERQMQMQMQQKAQPTRR